MLWEQETGEVDYAICFIGDECGRLVKQFDDLRIAVDDFISLLEDIESSGWALDIPFSARLEQRQHITGFPSHYPREGPFTILLPALGTSKFDSLFPTACFPYHKSKLLGKSAE